MTARILHGDCRQVLADLPDASIDSIVTDPPYEIGFMGKGWDNAGVAYDVNLWRECLRVLKPGGHLLAFGGTRTYHRMASAIEDAGFEVRDSIHWLYGSGFPKSLDVSKAIDKRGGYPHLAAEIGAALKAARENRGVSIAQADSIFCDGTTNWSWFEGRPRGQRAPMPETFVRIAAAWPELAGLAEKVAEAEREVVGTKTSGIANKDDGPRHTIGASQAVEVDITAPATDAARQWEGWGTALKPAHEPIVVARKPLSGTVAATVLEHGTGALNIDGTRVGSAGGTTKGNPPKGKSNGVYGDGLNGACDIVPLNAGRWPANLVLTHAADCDDECADGCPVAELDEQSGTLTSGARKAGTYAGKTDGPAYGQFGRFESDEIAASTGGASRFFTVTEWDPIADAVPFRYVAKPSRRERNADGTVDNRHPTVKPVALMRWLVRLVTPPGGTVLDPFTGSGTTGVAAVLEGVDFIGCEMTDDYLPIIEGRLAWAAEQANDTCDTTSGTSPEKGSHRNQPEHASQVSPDDHPNLFGDAA